MVRVVKRESESLVTTSLKQSSSTDIKWKPYKCLKCGKMFTRPDSLKRHKVSHESQSRFECDLCDKTFAQKDSIKRHMSTHINVEPYKCENCSATFTQSGSLKKHILSKHSAVQSRFKCDICWISFSRLDALQRHSRRHDQDKLYKCTQCPEKFQRRESLKTHSVKMHDCSTDFQSNRVSIRKDKETRLSSQHRKLKLEYQKDLNIKCEQCPTVCLTKQSVQKHMEVHTHKHKHKCMFCIASFRSSIALSRHQSCHGDKETSRREQNFTSSTRNDSNEFDQLGSEKPDWNPLDSQKPDWNSYSQRKSKRFAGTNSSDGDKSGIEVFLKQQPGTGVRDVPAQFELVLETEISSKENTTSPYNQKDDVIELVDVIKQECSGGY